MSIRAQLLIDDLEANVLSFDFTINRRSDFNGRPIDKPIFRGIELEIETRKDLNLVDWSFAHKNKLI